MGEMGLGELGLGEMGLGEMGLGEMGLGEMGQNRFFWFITMTRRTNNLKCSVVEWVEPFLGLVALWNVDHFAEQYRQRCLYMVLSCTVSEIRRLIG